MNLHSELIVMLTHNDHTVHNAYEIFLLCRNSKAVYWGFKEEPLSSDEMKKLLSVMKLDDFSKVSLQIYFLLRV